MEAHWRRCNGSWEEMWWLQGRDEVAHWRRCGGSLNVVAPGRDVVAHWRRCGGSLNVVAPGKRCGGSL